MLHLHRSASGLALVGGLAELLATPPDDPFAPELIAVPAQGIERWLAQRLSHRLGAGSDGRDGDGVCANVLFPRPDELLDQAVAATGPQHAESVLAWHPDRSAWVLLDLLDGLLAEPPPPAGADPLALLRHHLRPAAGGAPTGAAVAPSPRRYAVARRIAERFAGYAAARPQLIGAWSLGDDSGVPDDLRWQPRLWRELQRRVGRPHPAELLDDAVAAIEAGPEAVALPARFSLYGVSRLDTTQIRVLAALARHRDVHLWLNHASPALWDALRAQPGPVPLTHGTRRADLPPTAVHPLLASLSRDVRELQVRLAALAPGAGDTQHEPAVTDRPVTLLGLLQQDLQQDRVPEESGRVLDPADRSVQVHACHGRARQVEVLREVVLGLLADDPTLQARDVLVMCPDVEAFAPLVAAAFGVEEDHPAGQLRVRLADRSPQQVNPLLGVVAILLDLAGGRVTGSQLLDLASAVPVRRRFGFSDDDVEQLRSWAVAAGARWGLSASHRERWGMGAIGAGTWRAALDRLLTGAAMAEAETVLGGTLPLDAVDSADVDLAGRLAELVDRLDAAVTGLAAAASAVRWLDLLEQCVLDLSDVGHDTGWQLVQLRAELAEIRSGAATSASPLTLGDARSLLEQRLVGRPGRSGFRTGGMTVCTLVPMRSVPHRVVCLLGLDDGAFPRHPLPDGDDLLARDPRVGERDPRSEDRQLFLDAVLAATEHLVLTYAGAHLRSGVELPPAVPLGELLDALDRTAASADGRPVRETVLVRHPLQPFDARNFTPGALGRAGPLSFDRVALAGATSAAGAGNRIGPPAFLDTPLPAAATDEEVVELARLADFWVHPAKGFLRQRLELAAPGRDEQPAEAMPIDLNGLDTWHVADRMLTARLRGVGKSAIGEAELARGAVPPGALGVVLVRDVGGRVDRLIEVAGPWLAAPAQTVDVDVRLPAGRRLVGALRHVRAGVALTVTYSRIGAKQRLRAWIELLALAAAGRPDATAVLVGRGEGGRVVCCTLGPVPPATAAELLGGLAGLRDLGLRTPLPAPVGTAAAYAVTRHGGGPAGQALREARWAWQSGFYDREDADAEHRLVWGERAPLEVLTGWTPPADHAAVRFDGEPDAFGALACSVWVPLLEHKQESQS